MARPGHLPAGGPLESARAVRSRWGNYDLISNAGHVAAANSLVSADILASRMQGQDVHRSAFFDVVRADLGWDELAATNMLPLVLT